MKLKPCPNVWCPSNEPATAHDLYFPIGEDMDPMFRVTCSVCAVKGPIRKSREAAEIAWNTRKKLGGATLRVQWRKKA